MVLPMNEKRKRPREVTLIVFLGLPMAIILFLISLSHGGSFRAMVVIAFAYAYTLLQLFRLRRWARSAFIGFSVLSMVPFLLYFFLLIAAITTGQPHVRNGEVVGWLLGISMLLFPIFLCHFVALRWLIRPKVKEQFMQP